jgi:hypothetical protein
MRWFERRWARRRRLARITRKLFALMAVLTLVVSWGCDRAGEPKPPVVEPVDPAQMLRQMSEALAHARQLTFKATRQLDASLVDGSSVPEAAEIEVAVSRPNPCL